MVTQTFKYFLKRDIREKKINPSVREINLIKKQSIQDTVQFSKIIAIINVYWEYKKCLSLPEGIKEGFA